MKPSLKPASDFNKRVTSWQSTMQKISLSSKSPGSSVRKRQQSISWRRRAVKMELLYTGGHALKIALKSPLQSCLPRICNLHLHHRLDVRFLLNLPGIYLADIKHSDAIYRNISCRPCQLTPEITALQACMFMDDKGDTVVPIHVFFSIHILFLL